MRRPLAMPAQNAISQRTGKEIAKGLDTVAKHARDGKDAPLHDGWHFALPDGAVATADERDEKGGNRGSQSATPPVIARWRRCHLLAEMIWL